MRHTSLILLEIVHSAATRDAFPVDVMDQQGQVNFPLDALEPLIALVVERVMAKQNNVDRMAAVVQDQLLYSETQAAKRLGITPVALKEERLKGRIEYLKRGRQVRYLPDHLVEYVAHWADADQ